MSLVKIWVHIVWGTKHREPLLEKHVRLELFNHIRENAKSKGIYLDSINGVEDHVHCLVSMNANQNIAAIVQALKGESAFWVNNKTKLLKRRLNWCDGYYAVSIGESGLKSVRQYIRNQEAHHQKKPFSQECKEFMDVYGFELILD